MNAPHWVRSDGYDIDAREDEVTSARLERMTYENKADALRPMLRQLIQERFALKGHLETRQLPVLALMPIPRGNKLQAAKTWEGLREVQTDPKSPAAWTGLHHDREGHVEARAARSTVLVRFLGSQPEVGGRIVVDKTDLTGSYDFTLNWAPEDLANHPDRPDPSGAPLFSALQDQLGLKLQPMTEPIQVLVIDHIERPSPNETDTPHV